MKPFQKSALHLPDGMRVKAPTRDISNQRFGRLVAIKVVGKSKVNSLLWECRCDCGNIVNRASATLRNAKGVCSCGCYLTERSKIHLGHVPWNKGTTYTTKPEGFNFSNKKAWTVAVKRVKGDKCEICNWSSAPCDVHHIISRENGGQNVVGNGRVVCPNCHRLLHCGVIL